MTTKIQYMYFDVYILIILLLLLSLSVYLHDHFDVRTDIKINEVLTFRNM